MYQQQMQYPGMYTGPQMQQAQQLQMQHYHMQQMQVQQMQMQVRMAESCSLQLSMLAWCPRIERLPVATVDNHCHLFLHSNKWGWADLWHLPIRHSSSNSSVASAMVLAWDLPLLATELLQRLNLIIWVPRKIPLLTSLG